MQRRDFIFLSTAAAIGSPAFGHHGWSSFDQGRPLYLEGRAAHVAWRNPHVELDLQVAGDLKLPAGLAQRPVPAQSATVDGARLFAAAVLPTRRDKVWHIECAPLSRMLAWNIAEIRDGDRLAMVGFTYDGEKGDAVLRVEYLFVGDKTYGLRSSPA